MWSWRVCCESARKAYACPRTAHTFYTHYIHPTHTYIHLHTHTAQPYTTPRHAFPTNNSNNASTQSVPHLLPTTPTHPPHTLHTRPRVYPVPSHTHRRPFHTLSSAFVVSLFAPLFSALCPVLLAAYPHVSHALTYYTQCGPCMQHPGCAESGLDDEKRRELGGSRRKMPPSPLQDTHTSTGAAPSCVRYVVHAVGTR